MSSSVYETFRILWANPLSFIGFLLVLLIAGTAVVLALAPILSQKLLGVTITLLPYNPNAISNDLHQPPSFKHYFGTNTLGQDIYSQVMTALPLDLLLAVGVAGTALAVGIGLGLIAGFWDARGTVGGASSVAILRVTDVFLAFPSLVLAIALAALLGRGLTATVIALIVTWWPYYVRLVRGEVLSLKTQPYIYSARSAGVRERRIVTRHVLRNLIEPLMVYFTLDVGTVIVVFSTISYVGVGPGVGTWEWGTMIFQYQSYLIPYPWMVLAPGAAIFITVLAFSLFGDGLRDLLDPRSRRALAAPETGPTAVVGGVVPAPAS